jgi:hypothetical protein
MQPLLKQLPPSIVADVDNICSATGATRVVQLDVFAMPRFVIGSALIVERSIPVVQGAARARLDVGNKAIIFRHALPLIFGPTNLYHREQ